jgi:hypothetical protein
MPILDLHRDDVLLGRGALTVNNEGNKRFRSIVDPWKAEYQAANRKRKNEIAVTVVNEVFQRGGRFLERFNESEMQALGLPEHGRAWKVAEMHVALEKVRSLVSIADLVGSTHRSPTIQRASTGILPSDVHYFVSLGKAGPAQ